MERLPFFEMLSVYSLSRSHEALICTCVQGYTSKFAGPTKGTTRRDVLVTRNPM